VWGTVFSCCDCTMAYARKKEDPWNAISAGFLTGGILAARAGFKQMVKNAVVGGVILGLIEGVSIGVSRVLLPMYEKQVCISMNGHGNGTRVAKCVVLFCVVLEVLCCVSWSTGADASVG
jgi:hypothetical protein